MKLKIFLFAPMFSGVKKKYKDFFSISTVQSDYFELRESIHNFKVDLKYHWNNKLHDFQLDQKFGPPEMVD